MNKNMFGNKRNLIFIIVIFVGVTIYFIARNGSSPYSFSISDQTIKLAGSNDYSYSLPISSIKSMELTEIDDYGEAVKDASDRSHICGTYRNDQFGQYDLWVIKKISQVIVITDTDGHVLVINYENARSTQELYKALDETAGK